MEEIEAIIRSYGSQRRFLIPILQDIHTHYYYLPQAVLKDVAERLQVPLIDVYSVATFYNCFSLKPRGKHFIKVCLGTACHLKGGPRVIETLERELGVRKGEMTPDGVFTYDTVRCVGACSLAPLVLIDEKYHPKMSGWKITQAVQRVQRAERGKARPTTQRIQQVQPAV
jgi:NADH-quinone oxidoreductase subunit E